MRLASMLFVAFTLVAAHEAADAQPSTDGAKLLPGLGDHALTITTSSPEAQRFFNQGLSLAYAFNHPEALRAFEEAVRLDPQCAMCHWGVAYVLGPNINAAMDPAVNAQAHDAARRALSLALAPNVKAEERALIEAMSRRYAVPAPENRASLDSAFARAMRAVSARFPDHDDAAVIYAESMMILTPWVYWTRDKQPLPGTSELLASLERVMARDASHPGACHFYIHAVEAAYPERAVACAERLASLMPGAGHIVHMPAHIYLRVGRYDDAITANEHAVHADETYIRDRRTQSFYTIAYYPHNYHFLAFAAMLAGQETRSLEAARAAAATVPLDVAADAPDLQLIVAYPHLMLATFGKHRELLQEAPPPTNLRVSTGLAMFARGMALTALRRVREARVALDTVRAISTAITAYPVDPVMQIAERVLGAEIAMAEKSTASALAMLEEAKGIEDGLTYMEPPWWHQPVRHYLGAALVTAGRHAEAERAYREDLERFPRNVWAERGLARVPKKQ